MINRIITFLAFFLVFVSSLFANDTLRVMQYNLLYYDKNIYDCTSTNNNVNHKDSYLRTIFGEYLPDIFTVNEMNGSVASVNRLMNNTLNIDGVDYYRRAAYSGSEFIVNMLYYNSRKLGLHSQSSIPTMVATNIERVTDVYTLYYKSEDLETTNDTIFITCIVMHLKAGWGTDNEELRHQAAETIMSYIASNNITGNVMLMGDFNVYTDAEPAFQEFLSTTSNGVQFLDPVDAIGLWHDNSSFSNYHTQSTHTSGGNPCPSGGGMDDRFDFILTSSSIINRSDRVGYINDTYWAFGQDGNRLNQSLINPTNTSLPSSVINALYYMSDHLPVVLKLHIDANPANSIDILGFNNVNFKLSNPVSSQLTIWADISKPKKLSLQLVNLMGASVIRENIRLFPGDEYHFSTENIPSGIYVLNLRGDGINFSSRIVKI